jgi:magnesium transporter
MAEPIEAPESEAPWTRIRELAEREAWDELRELIAGLDPNERAHALGHTAPDELATILAALRRPDAADLIEQLPESQAASAIEEMPPTAAARVLAHLSSDDRADLLGRIETDRAEAILATADPRSREEARALLAYDTESAGGLMATELFRATEDATVGEVCNALRSHPRFADYQIQYVYVCARDERLRGIVPLRTLLLAPPETIVGDVMIREPVSVRDDATLEEIEDVFERYSFLGVPVVDASDHLIGVLHRAAVQYAVSEHAQADHMKALGIASGEELRSMPIWMRSRRRLAWLSLNIGLNAIAASVIASYQETLQAAIALAVFLPMISDMSGCSGNQAVAVTLRELTLGVLRPHEVLRVVRKEIVVGGLNGLVLGALIGGVAMLWQGSVALGVVVGLALALNTVVAVSIGGAIPLAIRALGQDPALASGPVLTTVTDVCGFFFALSFATVALDRIAL